MSPFESDDQHPQKVKQSGVVGGLGTGNRLVRLPLGHVLLLETGRANSLCGLNARRFVSLRSDCRIYIPEQTVAGFAEVLQ